MQAWNNHQLPAQEWDSNQEDSNNDFKVDGGIPGLHQSHRKDLNEDLYNNEDSLSHQVNKNLSANNPNNTVFVERPDLEASSKNPAAEYLETFHDGEGDDEFFKITNPGVNDKTDLFFKSPLENYQKAKKYLEKYEENQLEKSDLNSLFKVVAKLVRILEKVEAKGVPLTHIFEYPKHSQKKSFRVFFINLDLWGTWDIKSNIDVDKISMHLRRQAWEKVEFAKITLGRCIAIMKNEKGKLFEMVRFKATVMYNAFEKISTYLEKRTKTVVSFNDPLTGQNTMDFQWNLHKSDNILKEEAYQPSTDQNEEDKFESIQLQENNADESQVTEELKLEKGKGDYMRFANQEVDNPFKEIKKLSNMNNWVEIISNHLLFKKFSFPFIIYKNSNEILLL